MEQYFYQSELLFFSLFNFFALIDNWSRNEAVLLYFMEMKDLYHVGGYFRRSGQQGASQFLYIAMCCTDIYCYRPLIMAT